MENELLKHKIILIFITVLLYGTLSAFPSVYKDSVLLDPSIRYGKLSNGFTYYIKPTNDNSSQITSYLMVKAGVAVQDPDQYDMQHILEHVAFKAGKHMNMAKANSMGFRLGQINASTSFDFTQYYITSIDTKEKQDVAFQLFQDIIWDLEFHKEHIDSERSIIINEREIRGAFRAQSIVNEMEGSMLDRGAKRPSDLVKYYKTFPYEPLIRYYKDWYRPELMALIVVGDMDNVDEMEREISMKFSRAKSSENPRSVDIDYSSYRNMPAQFISQEHPFLSKDSNDQTVYLRLYMRQNENRENEDETEVLINEQKKMLFVEMLRNRYYERQKSYNISYNIMPKFLHPSSLGLKLHITINKGAEKKAILKAIEELKELQMNGFTQSEFKTIKEKYLESLSKTDTTDIFYWTDNIKDHFVYGKLLPPNRIRFLKNFIIDLTLDDFNQYTEKQIKFHHKDLDIIMLASPGHSALSYSENRIRGWIDEAVRLPVKKYTTPKIPSVLIKPKIVKALKVKPIRKSAVPLPGVSEYILDNGVRVVLKTLNTTFDTKPKRLTIHGFTFKGINCYAKEDYFSALNAMDIVKNSGVGGMDKFELGRFLTDKRIDRTVSPYINYDEAGIKGTVSLKDLEIALQLVYLYFTAPNKNHVAFEDWKLQATSSPHILKKVNADDFKTKIKSAIGDRTFLPKGTKALEGVSITNFHRAYEIYRDIFNNPKGFTFVFTGDFPPAIVLDLCQKYLGNLPVRKTKKECYNSIESKDIIFPKSRAMTVLSTNEMKQVQVQLVYKSKVDSKDYHWQEGAKLRLLGLLMNYKMNQELRFNSKKGGLYNISVGYNPHKNRLFNEIFVRFSCNPEDVSRLIDEVKQTVESFNKGYVDKVLLDNNIQSMVQLLETEKTSSTAISKKIHEFYKYGDAWNTVEQEQEFIKALSPEDIKRTAKTLLDEKPFEFKMLSK